MDGGITVAIAADLVQLVPLSVTRASYSDAYLNTSSCHLSKSAHSEHEVATGSLAANTDNFWTFH